MYDIIIKEQAHILVVQKIVCTKFMASSANGMVMKETALKALVEECLKGHVVYGRSIWTERKDFLLDIKNRFFFPFF